MTAGPGAGGSSPAAGPAAAHFGDRLAAAVAARESQIVLGLDPDPAALWPAAAGGRAASERAYAGGRAASERASVGGRAASEGASAGARGASAGARAASEGASAAGRAAAGAGGCADALPALPAAVLAHCRALIDAAGPACVAAKPQLACFERLGAAGWAVLEAAVAHARAAGLLVIADGKRGDVPTSARAYADALLGPGGLAADALTVNPLLGRDALAPFARAARAHGRGLFALVRTSNPGAADLLDLPLRDGAPFWTRVAALVADSGRAGASGLAEIGAVMGATAPEHLARARELMPAAPFLLPGIGAQGGEVGALAAAFAPGRAGGLVSASRSIADAHRTAGGLPADAARRAAERLREQAWSMA